MQVLWADAERGSMWSVDKNTPPFAAGCLN